MEMIRNITSPEKLNLLNSTVMEFAYSFYFFSDNFLTDIIQKINDGQITHIEELALELMVNPKEYQSEHLEEFYLGLDKLLLSSSEPEPEPEPEYSREEQYIFEMGSQEDTEQYDPAMSSLDEGKPYTPAMSSLAEPKQYNPTLFSPVETKPIKQYSEIYTIWIGDPIKDSTSPKFLHDVLGPISFTQSASVRNGGAKVNFVCLNSAKSWYEALFSELGYSHKVACIGLDDLFHDISKNNSEVDESTMKLLEQARAVTSADECFQSARSKVSAKELIAWCILYFKGGVVMDTGVCRTTLEGFSSTDDFCFPLIVQLKEDKTVKFTPDVFLLQSAAHHPVVKESLQFFLGGLGLLRMLSQSLQNNPALLDKLHDRIEGYERFMHAKNALEQGNQKGELPVRLLSALESTLVMQALYAGMFAVMQRTPSTNSEVKHPALKNVHAFRTAPTTMKQLVVINVEDAKLIKLFGNSHYALSRPTDRPANSMLQIVRDFYDNLRKQHGDKSRLIEGDTIGYTYPEFQPFVSKIQGAVKSFCESMDKAESARPMKNP